MSMFILMLQMLATNWLFNLDPQELGPLCQLDHSASRFPNILALLPTWLQMGVTNIFMGNLEQDMCKLSTFREPNTCLANLKIFASEGRSTCASKIA